ncbi:hypothetical protein TVAG_263530 [Trichomonas vaginalis G3]|uniref:DDE-1 domain-containing protein n=1 Tax=Trichomonas vaginalis (strain ATCC PRA-98 / G3) TaxID=412133 RepID=A2G5F6_TRIV3|nr:DDE endonuclease family [Trichomonas vaginalis G3]EAX87615.1 hypothetical protein TVAG_263530 [Trichomonas vaginalis G3]KAI5496219.1 DDE endonuclease family [Trichomonas vaginalis G3]|eukprot:XP_001300545.1 hypothetical protein [Trichomonas vaginalis G3]
MLIRQTKNGEEIPPHITNACVGKALLAANESGYMTKKLFLDWAKHFIAFVNKNFGEPHLRETHYLLLDSHISRRNKKALELFREHKIELITFPAHCTHAMQPFDVVIAHSYKTKIQKQYDLLYKNAILKDPSKASEFKEKILYNAAIEAYKISFTRTTCGIAFACTGLFPFSLNMLLERKGITPLDIDVETEIRLKYPWRLRITSTLLTDINFINKLTDNDFSKSNDRMIVYHHGLDAALYQSLHADEHVETSQVADVSQEFSIDVSSSQPSFIQKNMIPKASNFDPFLPFAMDLSSLNVVFEFLQFNPIMKKHFDLKMKLKNEDQSDYAILLKDVGKILTSNNKSSINSEIKKIVEILPKDLKYPADYLFYFFTKLANLNKEKKLYSFNMIDHFLFYKQNDPDISNPIEPQLLLQDKNIFLKKLARWPKYLCVCWIGEFEPEMLLSLNSSCE